MVGVTMVLAIVILVFGAAGLFAWLSRPFSDLIPVVAPAIEVAPEAEPQAPVIEESAPEEPVISAGSDSAEAPTVAPAAATEPGEFEPTHQIAADRSVNLRPQPSSVNSSDNTPIRALSPAEPLQFLDEDQPAENPDDAPRWMKFRTQAGEEGWVRELDTEQYQP